MKVFNSARELLFHEHSLLKSFMALMVICTAMLLFSGVAFASTAHNVDEAIKWCYSQIGQPIDTDGYPSWQPYQCVDLIRAYYQYLGVSAVSGNGADYSWNSLPSGWTRVQGGTPQRGDILVYSGNSSNEYGHVAIYESDRSTFHQNIDGALYVVRATYMYNGISNPYWGYIRPDFGNAEIRGSVMSSGFDRTIPDGDYLIVAAGSSDKSTFYYLDIYGNARPAANETNVSLCGPLSGDPPIYEIWTITYNTSDKFYTIKQKGTNMCLDVYYTNTLQGTNVQVSTSNGGNAQKWAIELNGSNGYRLRPKCSGGGDHPMCLDIANGSVANGTEVRQWEVNNSNAQSWLFIPYQPSQTLPNGRYILLSAVDASKELDVPGNSGNIADKTAVQLWDDSTFSQYNSFDITKLDNGFYSIIHHASGKALEVYGGGSSRDTSASLFTPNGSNAQQWAITKDGYNGGYVLRVKSSGYALDLANAATANGSKVRQFPWNGTKAETWSFVPAEYTVTFNLNGGMGNISNQIKYYKNALTLTTVKPTREGYDFLGWATSATAATATYQPGGKYTDDANVTLYAVWKASTYTTRFYYNYSGKNYLFRSDFASLASDCWKSRATSVCTISIDSSTKHNGFNSLKIVNASAGADQKDLDIQTLTNTGSTTIPTGVSDDKDMVLSFWAKASSDGTKMYFRWGYESASAYRSVTLTTSWNRYVVSMKKMGTFDHYIHPYVDRAGTVWMTEIQLEDGSTATDFVPENGGSYYATTTAFGGKYNLPANPTRSGYAFLGWYTAASGGTQITSSTNHPNADVRVYAHWKADAYSVSYNANTTDPVGNIPSNQTKTHGVDLALSADWPTREGYSFICWSTSADAYANNRYPGSVYTGNADLTLYAMWEKDGTEMVEGAGRCLLEGDYTIWAALDETLLLSIEGTALPSDDGKNVGLSTGDGNACDAWTLTYLNNGFYAIKQYGTDMALTVADGSVKYRSNIQVNHYAGSTAQQWSIEPTMYGCRLKARCSGFSADITGGADYILHGTNVAQWNNNEGEKAGNQSWIFKPFMPAQGLIPDFTLPTGLKTIGEEAFICGAFQYVKLAKDTTAIESKAFANCPNLRYIYIPEGCNTIAKDAFIGTSGLTIFGEDGSYAEFFANKYGYVFEMADN